MQLLRELFLFVLTVRSWPLADVGHTLMQHGVGILSVLVFEGQEIILVSKVVSTRSNDCQKSLRNGDT